MAPPLSDASASASTAPADTSAVAAAATTEVAEPKSISLNVRTLDHTTYPITIVSNATVLQLKELVAVATGVVFARQRLIFRGKVLKNDQSIAAYSLDDGHTLHLVVRAEAAVASSPDSSTTASVSTSTSTHTGTTPTGPAAPPAQRNNDEPDPTIGSASSGPNHVVMGATIALGDGANVSMPFLSSMIANIMSSTHGVPGHIVISETEPTGASAGSAGGHRASYAHFTTRAGARDGTSVRTRRSRAEPSLRSLSSGSTSSSSSRSRTSASASSGGSSSMTSGLANLRSRSENLMETVRSNIENTDYDFTGLDELQLEQTTETDAAFLQAQLTQLEILLEHFRTRLHLLPVALRVLQRRSAATASGGASADDLDIATGAPLPSVSAIVRTIDTLQSVGESVDILARIARYLFIRHNPAFTGSRTRLRDGESVRITAGSASTGEGTSVTVTTAGSAPPTGAGGEPTDPNGTAARRLSSERRASSHRRRHASARSEAARSASDSGRSGGNALLSLLERMNESIRGATSGLLGTSSESRSATDASASTAATPSSSAPTDAAPSSASSTNSSVGSDPPQLSVASFDIPLGSVVFPISFSDVTASSQTPTATTTWDFAALVGRLVQNLPSSHVFGVMRGDPEALHHVMAQLGVALVSGVDVPPVSRATIRTWSHTLVAELRSQLRAHGIPAPTLAFVDAHQQSSFVDQLIRPIEPFVPDLVDSLLRATSASRTAAFGASSAAFFATMSRQFVRHIRTYVGRDDETLARVLEGVAEHLGLDARLAAFAVGTFLDWIGRERTGEPTPAASARRRERDESASGASEPATKRRRGE